MRWTEAAVLALLLGARVAQAQEVEVQPTTVRPGELVTLTFSGPDVERLVGVELAGESLHLHPAAEGRTALAGIPVEAADSIAVHLVLRGRRRADTLVVHLAVEEAEFQERALTVKPSAAGPDSATSARIQDEVERADALAHASHATPPLATPPFRLPRESRITADFGEARTWGGEVESRHLGVDLAGGSGDPVRAPARGIVALVDTFHLGGTVLYLDHGEGLTTGYLHLSKALVAPGDTVEAGQVIAQVGRSGRAIRPHLHWVMRFGAVVVDPMSATSPD